ncbi:11069_t:CDS:2 [Entrophospora sp. SA101]|nr:11069_t:CDS:2 [Entrophospora sp. SA101]
MAFSTDYPPIDQSIECHLKDTCMKPQLNSSDQNFQQFIKLTLLPCGHIYHEYCLQHHEYNKKDLPIEDDPEDEIQPLEIDEPEELQMEFNLQAEIEFNTALQEQLIAYDEPINGKRAREDKENVSMITKSNKRPVLTNRNYLGKVDSNQTNENKHLYEYCNYIKAKKQKSSLFGFLVYSAYLSQISFKEDEEHTLSTAYMEKLGNEKENEHVQVRIFWNLFRDAMIDHKYTTFILYLDKFIQEWGWDELKEEVMFDKKLIKAFSSISSLQYNADLPDVVRIISKTIKLDLLVKNDVLLSGIIDTSSLHLDIVTELKLANKWEEVNEKPINEALPNGILEFIYEYIQREEKHQIPVEFMSQSTLSCSMHLDI